LLQEHTLKTEY